MRLGNFCVQTRSIDRRGGMLPLVLFRLYPVDAGEIDSARLKPNDRTSILRPIRAIKNPPEELFMGKVA